MQRYFFDYHDGEHTIDEVGTLLPNDVAAVSYARMVLIETVSRVSTDYATELHELVVRTDLGQVSFTIGLAFSLAFPDRGSEFTPPVQIDEAA